VRFGTGWAAAGAAAVLAALVLLGLAGAADGHRTPPAAAASTSTVGAAADTTISQVPQDGDGRARPTLLTCPERCDGDPRGERQAVLRFDVPAGPAGATVTAARLRLHTPTAVAASVAAYRVAGDADSPGRWADRPEPGARLTTRTDLTAGDNEWDVTAAVGGAGPVTLALTQSAGSTPVRWASREDPDATRRPRLVVTWSTPVGQVRR